MSIMNYRIAWLTVNRKCNLRCKWCYAREALSGSDRDMPFELAKSLVDLCDDAGIKRITLIGGEPTLYPQLIQLVDYIHAKGMHTGFPTNGIMLSDVNTTKTLMEHGIHHFSISIKATNRTEFEKTTGSDSFDTVLKGISNVLRLGGTVAATMVLTEDTMPSFLDTIRLLRHAGVKRFGFSFCYDFNISGNCQPADVQNPHILIRKFIECYPELDRITEHNFSLFQSFPLCLWDESFIEMLKAKNQIDSICQLLSRSGLLFDETGTVIPCNAMYELKLAKFGTDFTTIDELNALTGKDEFQTIYRRLCGVPDLSCLSCEKLRNCGGGCVCQWTNYSFKDIVRVDLQ